MSKDEVKQITCSKIKSYQSDGSDRIPNDETKEALKESEEILKNPSIYKSYHSFDEVLKELEEDT